MEELLIVENKLSKIISKLFLEKDLDTKEKLSKEYKEL